MVTSISSASAGVDYEEGGFYIGTWAADVGDGLEIDGHDLRGHGQAVGIVRIVLTQPAAHGVVGLGELDGHAA